MSPTLPAFQTNTPLHPSFETDIRDTHLIYDYDAANPETGEPETLKQANELLVRLADINRASRGFWLDYSQFLLMNLLLPVLTSVLGYVFGTARAGSSP